MKPLISIVTPSYNQGRYIERTIRSIIYQTRPPFEYFVMDGGSSDETKSILEAYNGRITKWESGPDDGQSSAINKGFRKCSGDVLCWVNSDDYLEAGTLQFVEDYFDRHEAVDVICGNVKVEDVTAKEIRVLRGKYTDRRGLIQFWNGYHMHQPSIFWRKRVLDRIGDLNEELHLTMDYDYWLRMATEFRIEYVDRILAVATEHPAQKTANSWAPYKRAQLRCVFRHLGFPVRMCDVPLSFSLYVHLLKTGLKFLLRRRTIYCE